MQPKTRSPWSPERYLNFHNSIASRTPEQRNTVSANISSSLQGREVWNKGLKGEQVAWNKGNNWRDNFTPEEVRAINAKRARDRRLKNPALRVNESVSCLIWQSLHGNKPYGWEVLVGYTLTDLKNHLESRFLPGMTWENYGEWHIDHIKPRAAFSFETSEDPQFKECWSLSNLQPLWAIDNLRKNCKY